MKHTLWLTILGATLLTACPQAVEPDEPVTVESSFYVPPTQEETDQALRESSPVDEESTDPWPSDDRRFNDGKKSSGPE